MRLDCIKHPLVTQSYCYAREHDDNNYQEVDTEASSLPQC